MNSAIKIPHKLDKKYFVHPKCYKKKVIFAQTLLKRNLLHETRSSKRTKGNLNEQSDLFSDICMICKKFTIKVSGKKQLPKKTLTFDATEQIKNATEKQDDQNMLLEIQDKDLIAKEFQKHEKCYRNYTEILYKYEPTEAQVYDTGNYERVCNIIEEEVIQSYKYISMKTLIEAYSIGKGQHKYRSKLKID